MATQFVNLGARLTLGTVTLLAHSLPCNTCSLVVYTFLDHSYTRILNFIFPEVASC